ncbi:uncharacterized protein CANTADRAFT_24967 [Suhomyces tanzawaensis NRRL Y-17324]|uniref:Transcription initiation factor TFIID subunit 8 n=1 Tax=Suhomyces tanzawaensis NRRL Y-17324 TaxID=984487 RepID=A0A1E4SSJ9_9ASCO|nr:uncharacterized protein CANTADRAFT_24967 [Suhomyces tanzawaensis NRRL Y-17324]ODV82471.1 hypothetical protein CANTADRAFT_24967 [Suhomyces tanzawaensis NRRL Y-17324]
MSESPKDDAAAMATPSVTAPEPVLDGTTTSSDAPAAPEVVPELDVKALDIEEAIEDIGKIESLQEADSPERLLLPETDLASPVLEQVKAEASSLDDWQTPSDIHSIPKHKDPIEFQLSKVIAVLLEGKGHLATQEYIDQVTDITIAYFNKTIVALRNFTELQRRKNPSLADTEVSFRLQGIHPWKLYDEITATRKLGPRTRAQILAISSAAESVLHTDDPPYSATDESLPFFTNEHYEIAELVPKQSERPIYIPSYLPDLPPDYTYQNTPKYMDTITDLKVLRLKLVEESRLTEKSLYDLIEDDERQWRKRFEKELEDLSDSGESIMSKVEVSSPPEEVDLKFTEKPDSAPDKPTEIPDENGIIPLPEPKAEESKTTFDFVEYANKRKRIIQKREDALTEKIRLRENNIFIKAEKYYSPYADLKVTPEIDLYFQEVLHDEFKSVIKAVRKAESTKKRKIEEILQEKAKRDKAMEDELNRNEFGFNFNQMDDSLDDEEGEGLFPQFDFDGPEVDSATESSGVRLENDDNEFKNILGAPTTAGKAPVKAPTHSPVPAPTTLDAGDDDSSDDDLEAELENAMNSVSEPTKLEPILPDLDSDEDELNFDNF